MIEYESGKGLKKRFSAYISNMLDKKLETQLEQLGLTAKESAVYLALLELGTVGTSKILDATKLHGQYVYQALTSLEVKGLVSHAIVRGRKKFQANHPKMLVRVAEQQTRLAEDLVQRLEAMNRLPSDSAFEVYQGQEAFIAHEEELLRMAPPGSELLIIGGAGDHFAELMQASLGAYEFTRRQKNIKIRYVGSQDQAEALKKSTGARFLFEARVLPGSFTGLVNTNIWPEIVNFNTFGTPVTSFVLKSKLTAESYRSFFETIWKMGK